ncbi:DUF1800 family protein [Falsiroseomonas sp.]|uniref:DUF1800 domain-containing protein n=1 Tax=Falsiroseomonas sp. TaxID=2870721 RepID=UPI00271F9BAC|nr:DUF1800 domain-containing protein [Falsiroseomonas sp.]MDO9499785.1 DUF1800 domain-containing protein [Falsiroseomonas sp.]
MSEPRHIAPIRFGHGLRRGDTPPADPLAWLEQQLATADLPAGGVSSAQAVQGRAETISQRQARDRAGAAAMQGGTPRSMAEAEPDAPGSTPLGLLTRAELFRWARQRLASDTPFRDRLADFWMNHFTVSRRNGPIGALPATLEREAIRPHLTGSFADMLVAVTRHPAMQIYLDHHVSVGPNSQIARSGRRARAGLNENLAREVLELHTLSPAGGYGQADVQELAKILTGWSVAAMEPPFTFIWRPMSHEPGEKTLLGRRFPEGPDSQEAALRMLGTHPATYHHLAVKLARHFVADQPPAAAVRVLEETLRRTEGDLGAVTKALIRLPEAWEPPLGKFRTHMDFVLAAGRAVGLERPELMLGGLTALGQPLWSAPQPNGWSDQAGDWMGPEALMRRVDWTYTFAGSLGRTDLAEVAQAALGPLARAETAGAMRVAGSVRDAITLLFTSTEFQHR